MPSSSLIKAGILSVLLALLAALSWEFYLRHQGIKIAYDDNYPLWADKRRLVYEPADKAMVFIGSSRIKYDLDIDYFEDHTGLHVVQLAVEGNSPRPALENLADDPNFKGKLVVDVTEQLFFSLSPFAEDWVRPRIKYYQNITPTQKASFEIDRLLESMFVFLDDENFSLNAMLVEAHYPQRPGVFPDITFPLDFSRTTFQRQAKMTPRFLTDTSLTNRVMNNWRFLMVGNPEKPVRGDTLQGILDKVKSQVDNIRSRGGDVLFVRTPCSNFVRDFEVKAFPRMEYWDRLLAYTGCKGIYYEDYPAMAQFECPEASHLSPAQATIFTKNLIQILNDEKGWIPKKL